MFLLVYFTLEFGICFYIFYEYVGYRNNASIIGFQRVDIRKNQNLPEKIMNIIMTVSTDHLTYHTDTNKFTTELSKHPGFGHHEKVEVRNPETENSVEFRRESVEKNSTDSRILYYHYVPDTSKFDDLDLFVFND